MNSRSVDPSTGEGVSTPEIPYPHQDASGVIWLDRSGMVNSVPGMREPCFWCGRGTARIDLNYGAAFCNSDTCNMEIAADLMRSSDPYSGDHGS